MPKLLPSIAALAMAFSASAALAHHSFAVFFDQEKTGTVTGVVQEFRFSNPHGTIAIVSKDPAGQQITWKAETNSPSIMLRRGWTKESLKVGETITMEGWLARDGSRYMRVNRVSRADGTPIGTAPRQTAAEQR